MKPEKAKMFPIPLNRIKAEDGVPFPLYLFLKLNNRFVPIRLPGDPIGLLKYEAFLKKDFAELWIPNAFKEAFDSYMAFTQDAFDAIEKMVHEYSDPKNLPEKSEEAILVKDTLEDEELSTEDKAKILSSVSEDLLRSFSKITNRGPEARAEGVKRCREIADQVLMIASQNSNIYEEILALRNCQEAYEHSVMVGTIAVMFALAIGISDETALGDIALAAIFHDVGLVRVQPEVLNKEEKDWSVQDRLEYEKHAFASIDVLKESGTEFHDRVFRMIREHHENYDGSGFPNKLRGAQIDELSQFLHLANLFDRLCEGKQTGEEMSPAEAFNFIDQVSTNSKAVQGIQPELVRRIFQFMLTEKKATDVLRAQSEELAKDAAANAMDKKK